MQLPRERGPLSRHVISALTAGNHHIQPGALEFGALDGGPSIGYPVIDDVDAQLALWTIYELHYRGFDGVDDDREWDLGLLTLRRRLEQRFERELREGTRGLLADVPAEGDVGRELLALAATADGPSVAAFLQRRASHAQMLDYLRERSVQQLKESDPQSFVLPRLDGPAKAALAELQYDEYGGGLPQRLHARLYADALDAASLDPAYGAYIDDVSALSLACTNVMTMFGLNRRLRGAAMGHLAVFEASSSVPCRKIVGGLERLGFAPAVAAYFAEHVEADAVHEQVASHDICAVMVAENPGLRGEVFFGAAACLLLDELAGTELLERWSEDLVGVS